MHSRGRKTRSPTAFLTSYQKMTYRPCEKKISALRSASMPFTLEGERIRNLHTIHVQNKTDGEKTYTLAPAASTLAEHPELAFIIPQKSVDLASFETTEIPIFVELERSAYTGPFPFEFAVTDAQSGNTLNVEVRFRGP